MSKRHIYTFGSDFIIKPIKCENLVIVSEIAEGAPDFLCRGIYLIPHGLISSENRILIVPSTPVSHLHATTT